LFGIPAYLRTERRPRGTGGRDPLPGARIPTSPRSSILRGPLPRVAPRDRRRGRGRIVGKPNACAGPAGDDCDISTSARSSSADCSVPQRDPDTAAASARRSSGPLPRLIIHRTIDVALRAARDKAHLLRTDLGRLRGPHGPAIDEDQTNLGYHLRTTPSAPVTIYRDGFGNRSTCSYPVGLPGARRSGHLHRADASGNPLGGEAGRRCVRFPERRLPHGGDHRIPPAESLVNRSVELDTFLAECRVRGTLDDVVRLLMTREVLLVYEKKVPPHGRRSARRCDGARGLPGLCPPVPGACRGIGLPARYVSGYIHQTGEVATHAWVPGLVAVRGGWVDVDPTHGTFPVNGSQDAIGPRLFGSPAQPRVWKGRRVRPSRERQVDQMIGAVGVDEWSSSDSPWSPRLAPVATSRRGSSSAPVGLDSSKAATTALDDHDG